MRSTQPPRIATWMLQHFGCSPNNEAVLGDLDERYRAGRSYMWYWRQVILTIIVSFFTEIWANRLLATRALLVGWLIKTIWLGFFAAYVFGLDTQPPKYILRLMPLFFASVASTAVCGVSAWLVSRVGGPHYRPMVLLYILIELLAVPTIINMPISLPPIPFPAVIIGAYGPIAFLWPQPFATYINLGLMNLGYPLNPVAALSCGSILMTITMLLGGRLLTTPHIPRVPRAAA